MSSKNRCPISRLNLVVVFGLSIAISGAIVSAANVQVGRIKEAESNTRLRLEKTGAHPENLAGRLVFSTQPIDPTSPANLTNTFNSGDYIYGALLLDKSFKEFVAEQSVRDPTKGFSVSRPGFEVAFEIDGEGMFDGTHTMVFQLGKKEGAWDNVPTDNYFIFDISPEAAKAKTYGYKELFSPELSAVGRRTNKAKAGAQFYSFQLSKLGPGNHSVLIKIRGNEEITGKFNITGSSYAFYAQVADKLDTVSASNTTMPTSQWNDPTLQRAVLAAFKKESQESVLRVVLVSPSWFMQKDSFGRIVFRGLFAVIATKKTDGTCFTQREYFKQDHLGGGRYGATWQDGRSETKQMIPCENVLK